MKKDLPSNAVLESRNQNFITNQQLALILVKSKSTMRKLKIDLSELEFALDNGSYEISFYLDIETGAVVVTNEEASNQLDNIYETYYDENTQSMDWERVFEEENLHDWQLEEVKKAYQVKSFYGERFIEIPMSDSHEGYRDMEAFIDSVKNPILQERLEYAIRGRGAFRFFKDVLLDFPKERERWFKFKQERLRQRAINWLESEEITLIQ
jgi:hypothetical protein